MLPSVNWSGHTVRTWKCPMPQTSIRPPGNRVEFLLHAHVSLQQQSQVEKIPYFSKFASKRNPYFISQGYLYPQHAPHEHALHAPSRHFMSTCPTNRRYWRYTSSRRRTINLNEESSNDGGIFVSMRCPTSGLYHAETSTHSTRASDTWIFPNDTLVRIQYLSV